MLRLLQCSCLHLQEKKDDRPQINKKTQLKEVVELLKTKLTVDNATDSSIHLTTGSRCTGDAEVSA